jgi:hypothetical protein
MASSWFRFAKLGGDIAQEFVAVSRRNRLGSFQHRVQFRTGKA